MVRKAANPERRALRLKAAAEYLSVSTRTIRTLIQRGELAIVRLCESDRAPWLVDIKDLDNLVERRKATL
jgi:excisionase family DNA binding protein